MQGGYYPDPPPEWLGEIEPPDWNQETPMPDPKTPRAPRGSKPLTCGQALDLAEQLRAKAIERAAALDDRHKAAVDDLHARQMRELAAVETELGAMLEKTIARVPEDQRDRARELCGVPEPQPDENARPRASIITNVGDMLEAAERDEKEQPIPPALLTEPEPVHAVEVDTATGKGRRTALGGGR
jgi:hypothetical protein